MQSQPQAIDSIGVGSALRSTQTVCPFSGRGDSPSMCRFEDCPDGPGRASHKEDESWDTIGKLSLISIPRSVILGLVPGIQLSASAGGRGWLYGRDPRDEPEGRQARP